MDCDNSNQGYNGGIMDGAFSFVISNGGIDEKSDYPYKSAKTSCNNKKVCSL